MGQVGLGELFIVVLVALCVFKPEQLQHGAFLLGKLWQKSLLSFKRLKAEIHQSLDPPP